MSAKQILISAHARFEMDRRGIKESDLIATVRNPGQTLTSTKGRRIFQSKIGSGGTMLLRVIVKETDRAVRVVTVYKTSKIEQYWRTP